MLPATEVAMYLSLPRSMSVTAISSNAEIVSPPPSSVSFKLSSKNSVPAPGKVVISTEVNVSPLASSYPKLEEGMLITSSTPAARLKSVAVGARFCISNAPKSLPDPNGLA